MVTNSIVGADVKAFAANANYLNDFIVKLATQWSSTGEAIVIASADARQLTAYFAAQAKGLLDRGVTIEQVNGQRTLFTIRPADGAYKVEFGEEEFMNYFCDFLRPQLVKMLFDR
jgi:V/A-type H+-transporting ATPase subunit E